MLTVPGLTPLLSSYKRSTPHNKGKKRARKEQYKERVHISARIFR